jgi:hypothetical protein
LQVLEALGFFASAGTSDVLLFAALCRQGAAPVGTKRASAASREVASCRLEANLLSNLLRMVGRFKAVRSGPLVTIGTSVTATPETAYAHPEDCAEDIQPGAEGEQGELADHIGSTCSAMGLDRHYQTIVERDPVNGRELGSPSFVRIALSAPSCRMKVQRR